MGFRSSGVLALALCSHLNLATAVERSASLINLTPLELTLAPQHDDSPPKLKTNNKMHPDVTILTGVNRKKKTLRFPWIEHGTFR